MLLLGKYCWLAMRAQFACPAIAGLGGYGFHETALNGCYQRMEGLPQRQGALGCSGLGGLQVLPAGNWAALCGRVLACYGSNFCGWLTAGGCKAVQ